MAAGWRCSTAAFPLRRPLLLGGKSNGLPAPGALGLLVGVPVGLLQVIDPAAGLHKVTSGSGRGGGWWMWWWGPARRSSPLCPGWGLWSLTEQSGGAVPAAVDRLQLLRRPLLLGGKSNGLPAPGAPGLLVCCCRGDTG